MGPTPELRRTCQRRGGTATVVNRTCSGSVPRLRSHGSDTPLSARRRALGTRVSAVEPQIQCLAPGPRLSHAAGHRVDEAERSRRILIGGLSARTIPTKTIRYTPIDDRYRGKGRQQKGLCGKVANSPGRSAVFKRFPGRHVTLLHLVSLVSPAPPTRALVALIMAARTWSGRALIRDAALETAVDGYRLSGQRPGPHVPALGITVATGPDSRPGGMSQGRPAEKRAFSNNGNSAAPGISR
ncbi:hypothetical protein SKAU_G00072510 [Synaphobranchus kaupii]|uniref:Uncharacterized protein n=1 Tax=Synaphobranchus kaupii TaxID=118154 RepID=A0A9Q1G804_SYNKA|nr:hypothetical protein SKAU_G00072510 [Synaphobranchus kaupii]